MMILLSAINNQKSNDKVQEQESFANPISIWYSNHVDDEKDSDTKVVFFGP